MDVKGIKLGHSVDHTEIVNCGSARLLHCPTLCPLQSVRGLFYFYFLIGLVWWTFLFLFFIGQVGYTTDRQTLSKYLQMLTEEIQKENIKYIYKIPSQMEV